MQLHSGTLLRDGQYKIIKTLGQGGFGITYLAEDTFLEQKVCIKEFFIKEYCSRDEETSQVSLGTASNTEVMRRYQEKFLKEARNAAKLQHPNIVGIKTFFKANNTAYIVMDYVDGRTVSDIIKAEGAMQEARALDIIRNVGDALSYAHSKQMMHLDIKPANIMLKADGTPVLIDFGMSKNYEETGEQTSTTPVGLSHGYAPLEQYKAGGVREFSPSTDVYSLGATLYKMLTGITPPQATDIAIDGLPEMPKTISGSTRAAVKKAMSLRKADRQQTVDEFVSSFGKAELTETPLPDDEETVILEAEKTALPDDEETEFVAEPHVSLPKLVCPTCGKEYDEGRFCTNCGGKLVEKRLRGKNETSEQAEEAVKSPVTAEKGSLSYVDLGLSVKWATCNLGASNPEDYGDYYAWGETAPKSEYSPESYKFGKAEPFSKYQPQEKKLLKEHLFRPDEYITTGDGKYTLEKEDDAATVNLGGNWRMPTAAEWNELRNKCWWSWTTQNGKDGYKVTSKTNGNSIFLPAAGYHGAGALYSVGSYGCYWSSSLSADVSGYAQDYVFSSDYRIVGVSYRCSGLSVRPVKK